MRPCYPGISRAPSSSRLRAASPEEQRGQVLQTGPWKIDRSIMCRRRPDGFRYQYVVRMLEGSIVCLSDPTLHPGNVNVDIRSGRSTVTSHRGRRGRPSFQRHDGSRTKGLAPYLVPAGPRRSTVARPAPRDTWSALNRGGVRWLDVCLS